MQIISIRGTPGSPPIGAILNISTSLGGKISSLLIYSTRIFYLLAYRKAYEKRTALNGVSWPTFSAFGDSARLFLSLLAPLPELIGGGTPIVPVCRHLR